MDGFIGKPVDIRTLASILDTVEQHLNGDLNADINLNTTAGATTHQQERSLPILNLDVISDLQRYSEEGKDNLFEDLRHIFTDSLPVRLREIQESFAARDWNAVDRSAHQLKGSAGVVGAERLVEICGDICRVSHDEQDREQALEPLITELKQEAANVKRALGEI